MAEPYIPNSKTRLTKSSRKIVAGSSIAIAIAGPIPGIAPITTPPIAPIKIAIMTYVSRRLDRPSRRASIRNKFS